MSLNATIKLKVDDMDVLRPINIFDIAYKDWCESHNYVVGDAQRVSLYVVMHLKNYTNISQLKEFKTQLEDFVGTLETLEMSKPQDKSILHWCGIFLIACQDWKAPINPRKNVSIRVCQVDFAKPLSYLRLVLRSLKSLGTSLKRSMKKNPSEYGFATRQEKITNSFKKSSTKFAFLGMGF